MSEETLSRDGVVSERQSSENTSRDGETEPSGCVVRKSPRRLRLPACRDRMRLSVGARRNVDQHGFNERDNALLEAKPRERG